MKELSTVSVVLTKDNGVVAVYGYTPDEEGIKEATTHYNKLALEYMAKFQYNVSLVKALYKPSNVRYIKSMLAENRFAKIIDGKFDTIKQNGVIETKYPDLKDIPYTEKSGWVDCTEADYLGQCEKPVARTIHEYVKDMDGNRVGCFVGAGVCGEGFDIGWSKVNVNGGDVFDKNQGFDIALKRAQESKSINQKIDEVPDSLMEYYLYFQGRCKRYFKCDQLEK